MDFTHCSELGVTVGGEPLRKLLAVAIMGLLLVGCTGQGDFDEVNEGIDRLDSRLAALEMRLQSIESGMSEPMEMAEPVDLSGLESRLAAIESGMGEMSGPSMMEGEVIPAWVPGTTRDEAETVLTDCLGGRFSRLMGPFGAAFASSFMDFEEILGEMPDDLFGVGDNEAANIWLWGSVFGCWTGELE